MNDNEANITILRIRDWREDDTIFTNEGYLPLPDIDYPARDFLDQEDPDYLIEVFYNGRWLQVQNIDFE